VKDLVRQCKVVCAEVTTSPLPNPTTPEPSINLNFPLDIVRIVMLLCITPDGVKGPFWGKKRIKPSLATAYRMKLNAKVTLDHR
jgi:hypothetical protein